MKPDISQTRCSPPERSRAPGSGLWQAMDGMQRLRFKKIDAFVFGRSVGNPAGCIYLDGPDTITPHQMQQIARELAGCVSEVVYLHREDNIPTLRFYSAEREVTFCGHGTIAAMYDLIKNDPDLLRNPIVSIHIGDQQILVRNEIAEEDAVYVSAPLPLTLKTIPDVDAVAAALKLPPGEIADPAGISVVSAGLVTLIVPLRSLSSLLGVRPDTQNLKEFCTRHGIEIVLVHTKEVSTDGASFRTRVFAPVFGYLEDPATGSGNAAFGYHLLANSTWDGKMIRIEQGRNRDNPNIIHLVSDSSERQRTVYFGGNGAVRIEGEYLLQ